MTNTEIAAALGQAAVEEAGCKWEPTPPGYNDSAEFKFCFSYCVLHVAGGFASVLMFHTSRGSERRRERLVRYFELADPQLVEKLAVLFRERQAQELGGPAP